VNRRDFLKGIACAAASVILPKATQSQEENVLSPGSSIWLCERSAHQEIASIPKGGYVVPKHLEGELVSMLRNGSVVVGRPISIPLILKGDLISLDDEVES
jgi:hypothetical protein